MAVRREKTSAAWETRVFGNVRLVAYPPAPGPPGAVQFSTLQKFKGLEEDAVLLCEVKPTHAAPPPQHLYVAASRARHVLLVLEYE